jgi:hypothetical protein
MQMKQIYIHYLRWEDFNNGMYNSAKLGNHIELIEQARMLLSNFNDFYSTMELMINEWPICTDVNLTNLGQNRKAWLGAAACNFKYRIPETLTRIAWNSLTKNEQEKANLAAKKIIKNYEKKHSYAKTLFEY